MRLDELRRDYGRHRLEAADLQRDPERQFRTWLQEAIAADLPEPNAMTLATADASGRPSARIVLLKEAEDGLLRFVTNFESGKARDLAGNPRAALVFLWQPLERQVRVEGAVARSADAVSDRLFAARPRDAQLGAWASPQSRPVADRDALDALYREAAERWPDAVERPPFWGAYELRPERWEFWQGRASRMHDRFVYLPAGRGAWRVERRAP